MGELRPEGLDETENLTGLSAITSSMVAEVASAVASVSNLDEVTATIARSLQKMGAVAVHVLLLDAEHGRLDLSAQVGLPSSLAERLSFLSLDAPLLAARAARTRQIQVVTDRSELEREMSLAHEVLETTGSSSMISAPLMAFGSLVGVLTWTRRGPIELDENAATTIRSIAEVFALGIVNARNVAALSVSNQRFEQIIGSSAVGMALVALDGRFVRPNRALCEMLGYSPEELKTLRFQDITHPDDLAADLDLVSKLENGEIPRYEMSKRYIRKDGRVIDVILHGSAVREEGRVLYFIAQVVDVSNAKRHQIALEKSEGRFRLLAENAQDLIYRYRLGDAPGFDYVSPSATTITGYTPDEHYADPMLGLKLVHSEDRHLLEAVKNSPSFDSKPLNLRFVRKDGRIIWVEQVNSPVVDANGKIIAVDGIARDVTDRKLADEKLRESEERLRFVVEHSRDVVFIQDHELRNVWVTNDFAGAAMEAFLGKTDFDLLPIDQAARLAQLKRRVMATGQDLQTVSSVYFGDRERILDINYSPWRGHDDKIIGVAAFVRDITETKRTEKALRESKESLQLAQRVARIGSWDWNLATGSVTWSDEVYRIFGLPAGVPVSYADFLSYVLPEDRSKVDLEVRDALSSGSRYEVEHRIERVDGAIRVLREEAEILGPPGEPARVVGTVQDVTEKHALERERKELLEALESEKRWFETVVDRSPIGILLINHEGRLQCNEHAQKLFGRAQGPDLDIASLDRQIGGSSGNLDDRRDRPFSRLLAGEVLEKESYCLRRSDGSEITVLLNASPIYDEKEAVIGGVAVFEDITEMKRAERAREEWIGIIVHDLRQPLSAMTAQAELLEVKCESKGDFGAKFNPLLSSLHRMNEMVTELLDATVIEAKRLQLRPMRYDLSVLTDEILQRHDWPAGRVRFSSGPGPVLAYVDQKRYEQILINLLSNALKYGRGDAPITLEIQRRGADALVSVANEGEGIASEELPSLFERFHRTPEGKAKASGHGLGLYIVKGLVEAHGGKICVESKQGETTTFTFSLPTAAEQ